VTLNRLLLTAALLPFTILTAQAQNTNNLADDEIIVTGLRAVPIADVTSSVTILDFEALSVRNSPFVADQLRAVPSLGVSRSGGLANMTQVRIRGAEANHTLVLLNGVEVSDPVTGETDFGLWSGLNTQRIEVARGEQSGLYGSDAIGGVISITTGGDGFSASGEYGSFDTLRGQAGYHGQVEGLTYGLALSGFTTDGVDISGTEGGDRDGSTSYSGIYTAGLEFNPDVTLSALASYRVTELDFDGFSADADNSTDADQWIAALTLDAQTGLINHILRANYSRLGRENFSGDTFADETIGQRTKFSYSPSLDLGDELQGLTVSVIAEVEGEDFERIDTNTVFGDPNQNASFNTIGLGGEVRGRFNGLAVNGSLRFDDNDNQFQNTTTWRFGAAYNLGFGGKIRGSIGTGVKNPTFDELFGFFPDFFTGNPDLVPEESQSWEIGYDHDFGTLNTSITYFNAELENEIVNNAFFNGVINQTGESERSGVEASADWQINEAISLSGFGAYIESENEAGVDEIRVPEFTASASANWESQTKDGLRAGIAVDFVGEQLDIDFGTFDPVTFQSPVVALDSYFLLSATAEYPVTDNLSLTLRGENLLDETTTDVFGFNQPGAGVFVGFKLR